MADLIPKKDDIDALIKSYFIEDEINIRVNYEIVDILKDQVKNQTDLYKAMTGVVNPYTLYNNQDRFLNLSYRYRRIDLGYNVRDWWEQESSNKNSDIIKNRKENYEARYNQLSGYLWASTAILGIGYSINSVPGIIGNPINASTYKDKRYFSDIEWIVAITRSSFNATIETALVVANYPRHHPSNLTAPQINANLNPDNEFAVDIVTSDQIRTIVGGIASLGFALNGLLGVGMGITRLVKLYEYDSSINDKAAAYIGLTAISFNTAANLAKALSSYHLFYGNTITGHSLGYWGSVLGLANGLANIAAIGVQISDLDKVKEKEQKNVLISAMVLQAIFGGIQLGANARMAYLIAHGTTSTGGLGGPLVASVLAGALGVINIAEIYNLVQQSKYVDRLKELGETMKEQGYEGGEDLYEIYAKKLEIDRGIFAGTIAITIIGVAVQLAFMAAPTAGAYLASGVLQGFGLVLNIVGSTLKGIQQDLIEDIAQDYKTKIENSPGGSFEFFSKETLASYRLMLKNPEFQKELEDIQVNSGVDSVVGVTTMKMTPQGLELAAFTELAANLDSAGFYINRFVNGVVEPDQTISLYPENGIIDLNLTGQRPGKAGNTQLLTFLTPLMAPGEEKRTRVSTGKNSYYTSLDIISQGHSWTINDGAMNTIMDVQNVVTSLYDIDDVLKFSVPLILNGDAGDDTVFAGASNTTFNGGNDVDTMSYASLSASSSISVAALDPTKTDSVFTVHKKIKDENTYKEVIASRSYSVGKRSEVVEYRDIDVEPNTSAFHEADDTLNDVEIISGSKGNDTFSGNAAQNIFRGEAGDDTLSGLAGDDVLSGGSGNDELNGGEGQDAALYVNNTGGGNFGIKAVLESAVQPSNPVQVGGVAAIYGTVEEQWLPSGGPAGGSYPNQSVDKLISIENLAGSEFADDITGSSVANLLTGGKGNDRIDGKAGDDTLIGNEGNDSLSGGDGNDYFVQNDNILVNFQDTIDGGAGDDIVDYSAGGSAQNRTLSIIANLLTGNILKKWTTGSQQFTSADTVISIEKVIGNVLNDIIIGNTGNNEFLGLDGEDTLEGGDGNDSLAGGLDNDTLKGEAGDDLLLGQMGNDLLSGGAGNDTLRGGNGLDTLSGDDGIDWADFSDVSGLGGDGVWATLKDTQATPGEAVFGHWAGGAFIAKSGINSQLLNIENLYGTRNTDYLVGNSNDNLLDGSNGDDRIEGKAGNDILIGGAGADDMDGGDGEDTFIQDFDTVNDTIKGGAGKNTVDYSWAKFAPSTNGSGPANGSGPVLPSRVGVPESTGIVADLVTGRIDKFPGSTLPGFHGIDTLTDIQKVVGSVLNDTITGNAEGNALYGAAGDDFINASDGADWVDGGGGNDTLKGGEGDDELVSEEGSDVVNGEDGDDDFYQSFEYKNDTLDGGAGYDRLSYEKVIFDATKITEEYRHGIEADLSIGHVYKFNLLANDNVKIFDTIRNIEGVFGTTLNDSLKGDDNDNYLGGFDGGDTINAGAGSDVIEAGNGDDLVDGEDGNDHVKQDLESGINTGVSSGRDTLDGGEGIDKLDYSLGLLTDARITARLGLGISVDLGLGKVWKLPGNTSNNVDTISNFEQIICTAWKDNLYGDANDNHFDAKEGDDTIDSREGNDFLEAGEGDDSAMGGSGDDTLSGDQGNDTLYGNAGNDLFAQHLIRENDTIDGGDGIDKIKYSITTFASGTRGVMGNVGIHANLTTGRIDKFEVDAATGFDSVSNVEDITGTNFDDSIIGNTLANNLEGAGGNDYISGEEGNDALGGSSGNDTLDGGNGKDFLAGGPGNDLLIGRAGSDFYEILSNSGNDVVEDFSTGTDQDDVIEFKDGIVSDDLWFSRNADNLIISILGTPHAVTVKDWFISASHQLESIRTADGKRLTNIQVATLLDSMAAYPVPANGDSVPGDVSNAIIATWALPPAAASAATTPSTTTTETAQASATLTPQRSSSARTPLSWILVGDGDDNDFTGQAGNDSFDGSAGNDTIDGGAGNDSIDGGINVDILLASDDDALFGNEGNDTLNGGAGNDLLSGGRGADLIQGGQGNDIILQEMSRSIDTIHGGDGIDQISYSSNADTKDTRADLGRAGINANLTTGRIDKFEAGSLNGFDVVSGIENVVGSALDDGIMGASGSNLLGGGAGDDVLQGLEGHDSLYGGSGRDMLTGGAGNDLMDGEAGNDRIRQELTRENDTIIGGGANDFLDYSLTTSSTGLREEMGSAGITGDLTTGRFDKFEANAVIGFDTVSDMDNVIGSFFNDAISGDWFNNFLGGLSGNDTLRARAGFDTLDGGLGNDLLEGGEDDDLVNGREGNDRIVQDMSRSRDTLSGGSGIDTVDYSTHIFDGKTAEQSEIRSLLGISGFMARLGHGRIDKFEGGGVRGWLGNRGITADLVQGRIDKFEVGGVDSFDTVSDIENVTGSVMDDTLNGNAGNNLLNGAAGNDTLSGGGGFDSLTGGAGDDWILAGFLIAIEQIDGGEDIDTADYTNVLGSGRSITVDLAEGWVKKYQGTTLFGADLLSNIEAVIATRYNDSMCGSVNADILNGDAGHDTLIGNAGDDILIGGIGNDYVTGEAGNDFIIQDCLDGNDTLDGGADIDTLDYSKLDMAGASFVLDLATGTVLKYQNGVLAGRDTLRNIENIIFSRYNDQLNGSANNDVLDGNSGNDTLKGGAGNDTMLGGRGDDLFIQDILLGNDNIDGGIGVDALDYSALAGASVAVDLANQNAIKYQNGTNVGIDTLANVEVIRATRNNDSLSGSIGEDVLCGDAGNDLIYGNAGNDNVVGEDGNDVVIGNDGDDILSGGNGDDVINGNAGDDILNGGHGNDFIVGEEGNDLIIQSDREPHHWSIPVTRDTIDGGSGIDMVDYSKLPVIESYTPPLESRISLEVDLAAGTAKSYGWTSVYVSYNNYRNVFDLRTADSLRNIEGIAGTEVIDRMSGSANADILNGNGGNDTLLGLGGKDALSGGTGDDFLSGDDGNDVLNGDAGNDTLYGKSGHDAVFGGEGNDLIVQDIFEGDDTVDGGSGIDTLDYGQGQLASGGIQAELSAVASGGIQADLSAGTVLKYSNNVALSLDESGAVVIRPVASGTTASGTTASVSSIAGNPIGKDFVDNIENLIGTGYQDILTGSLNAETLNGGAGNDTFNGAGGNDFIMGGEGDDVIKQLALLGNCTFDGGNGNDVVDYSNILLNGGSIQFNTTTSTVSKYKNGELVGTDTLRNIESFISSPYNDAIIGNALAEKLDGRAGNDSIDGGAASDTLIGGAGNDTLNGSIGFDSVTGGEGDDLIIQNSWDDFDTLDGGNGFDTLDFSGILVAGASISVDLANGRVGKFNSANVNYTIANFEHVIATRNNDSMKGSINADILDGGAGNDTLNGGAGDDMLFGGTGNDLFIQSALAYETDMFIGNDGIDTLDYSLVQLAAGATFGIEVLLNGGVVNNYDNLDFQDGFEGIEIVIGTRYNDKMNGSSDANTLVGGAGNDTLDGEGGNDSLVGGDGDDYIFQDYFEHNSTFDGAVGFDTVDYRQERFGPLYFITTSVRIDLGAGTVTKYLGDEVGGTDMVRNIESIIATFNDDTLLGGSGADLLNGSGEQDFINGAAGNDTLQGGMGNDTLFGGAGNDVLTGDEGDDLIMQDLVAGNDTLDGGSGADIADYSQMQAAIGTSFSINANLTAGSVIKYQAGVAIGTDKLLNIESVIGTSYGDSLTGSANADLLKGEVGSDTLCGSAGNDTLDGGADIDTLDYSGMPFGLNNIGGINANLSQGSSGKFVNGSLVSTDVIRNVERFIGTRFNDTLAGDANDNTLIGGNGNDVISGAAGNDMFVQDDWRGSDTFDGGAGLNTIDYSKAQFAAGITGSISVNLLEGWVKKIENGAPVATDSVSNIEKVIGTAFSDTLVGDGNDNILLAGDGSDSVSGGAGNDTILQENWNSNETLNGGSGSDMVDYSKLQFAPGTVRGISANLVNGVIRKFEDGLVIYADRVTNIEGITGTQWNDTIEGNGSDNLTIGGAGDDNFIQSSVFAKSDTIDGGDGFDTLDYTKVQTLPGVISNLSINLTDGWIKKYENGVLVGTDIVRNIENVLTNLENLDQVGNDVDNVMRGSIGPNVIRAMAGNDTIIQTIWGDADVFDGGEGSFDTLDYSQAQSAAGVRLSNDVMGLNVDLQAGRVEKFENGVVVATDTVSGFEHVIGSKYNDTMTGLDSVNYPMNLSGYLDGGDGDDILTGKIKRRWNVDNALDTLNGGNGNDTLYAYIATQAFGGAGDDLFILQDSNAYITVDGGSGADTVDLSNPRYYNQNYSIINMMEHQYSLNIVLVNGGYTKTSDRWRTVLSLSNIENIIGTIYGDTIRGDSNANLFDGRGGNDNFNGGSGNDTLIGGIGNDSLDGGLDNDALNGGEGNDSLVGFDGDDAFVQDLLSGNDTLDGGSGVDTADYSGITATGASINAALATQTVSKYLDGIVVASDTLTSIEAVTGTRYNDTLSGAILADTLKGDAGNDLINGAAGSDSLSGGEGNDTLDGGADNDTLKGDAGNDLINGAAGSDSLSGGEGDDTLDGGADNDILKGDAGDDLLNGSAGTDSLEGGDGNDTLDGGADNDTLKGDAGDDLLNGSAGTDSLEGGEGNDTLDGGADNDILNGGSGDDTAAGGDGNDTLNGGSGNDTLVAGAGNDVITGADGNSVIVQDVFAGSDTLDGGAGFDIVDYSSARIAFGATGGINANLASATVIKYQNGLTLGTDLVRDIEQVVGSVYNDTLSGGANADLLGGDAGNDLISGAAGNDTLNGGDGADTLSGGIGIDLIEGGEGDDRIVQDSARENDSVDGGAGFDTTDYSRVVFGPRYVTGGINANLAGHWVNKYINSTIISVDYLNNIESLIGTKFNDTMLGDERANTLTGGDGNNLIAGGAGDDTFLQVSSRSNDTLDGGNGLDTVDYRNLQLAAGLNSGISANLSASWIKKYEMGLLLGTDILVNNMENISGSQFNDTVVGDAFNNVIAGDAGNDSLDGGAGNDTLSGGLGNDTVIGGAGNDRVLQTQVTGNDTIDGGIGYDILDYSDLHFAMAGTTGIAVTLYQLSQVRKFDQNLLTGTDTVSNVEHVIGTSIADNMMASLANDCLEGRGGNDTLIGLHGDDTLLGGDGNDRIEGGLDKDMIDGGAGDDLIRQDMLMAFRDTINGGDGIDTVDYSLTNFTTATRTGMGVVGITANLLTGRIDKFQAGSIDGYDTVSNIENLIGTVFNDTLIGNTEANLFDAGAGDDWINGGGGNDTLLGAAGNDIYHFDGGFENVRVRDTSGVRDVIEITNASPIDYTAVRAGLDLKIWRTGEETNVLTVADWYSGAGFQIEEFRIGNALITSSDMNLLVSTTPGSMAQFPRTVI